MVKCANCKHKVLVTAAMSLEPGQGIKRDTYRCSYFHRDMRNAESDVERECEGFERL
jgi:hypothetical protein